MLVYHGHAYVARDLVDTLQGIKSDLAAAAGLEATLEFDPDPDPNAFVRSQGEHHVIILNAGLLQAVGDDRDAYAFVIGHELAHAAAQHVRAQRSHETQSAQVGDLISVVLEAAGVPLGLLAVEAGTRLVALGYSRDQEREADRHGLELMVRAGYDPHGALRFHRVLLARAPRRWPAMFSTHPPGEERLEALQALIEAGRSGAAGP